MRNPGGYAIICEPGKSNLEFDTFSCRHCNRVIHVKAGARAEDLGGLCKICMGLICSACVDLGTCDPLEAKLARAEARYEALRSYGMTG